MRKLILPLFFLTAIIEVSYSQSNEDTTSLLKKEIYNTYYDFMNGIPSEITDFRIDSTMSGKGKWEGAYFKTLHFTNNPGKIINVWGFCDGVKTYVAHFDFFELIKEDDRFSFTGFGIEEHGGAAVAGFFGGAIGATLYHMAESSKARRSKNNYVIDISTGLIFNSDEAYQEFKGNIYKFDLIIYRERKKEREEPVFFNINDDVKCNFIPNSYLRLQYPNIYEPVTISYTDSMQIKYNFKFRLDLKEPVYIVCSYPEEGRIDFIQVSKQVGEFDSFKPKKEQMKRKKQRSK